jgi:hypothetical protein
METGEELEVISPPPAAAVHRDEVHPFRGNTEAANLAMILMARYPKAALLVQNWVEMALESGCPPQEVEAVVSRQAEEEEARVRARTTDEAVAMHMASAPPGKRMPADDSVEISAETRSAPSCEIAAGAMPREPRHGAHRPPPLDPRLMATMDKFKADAAARDVADRQADARLEAAKEALVVADDELAKAELDSAAVRVQANRKLAKAKHDGANVRMQADLELEAAEDEADAAFAAADAMDAAADSLKKKSRVCSIA